MGAKGGKSPMGARAEFAYSFKMGRDSQSNQVSSKKYFHPYGKSNDEKQQL
jgi:hypothetical protein